MSPLPPTSRAPRPAPLRRRPAAASLWAAGLLALAACGSPGSTPEAPSEAPVREGLNDTFLSDELDVAGYVERFEGESREVYAHRAELVAALGLEPGMDVADVGAGTGAFEALLAAGVGPEGTVYAVDIAPGFVEHLTERARREGTPQVRPVLGDERDPHLEPGSVDRVFVCDTYHHFTYPHTTGSALHAALRPGGELLLVDFERIEGVSREWILGHVRAGREVFTAELEACGFEFVEEVPVEGLEENYVLRFRR